MKLNIKEILNNTKFLSYYNLIDFGGYCKIHYYSNHTNCKLCTFEYLRSIFTNNPKEKNIKLFNQLLIRTGKRMFFTHVVHKEQVENISKYYKLIYCQEIPLGYGSGMQYHCAFLINPNDETYGNRITKFLEKNNNIQKPIIEINNNNSIEEFIKKASNEEIDKLRLYKQSKRKKDLIEKINNKI